MDSPGRILIGAFFSVSPICVLYVHEVKSSHVSYTIYYTALDSKLHAIHDHVSSAKSLSSECLLASNSVVIVIKPNDWECTCMHA